MISEYFLPKIKTISIVNYDLYKSPFNIKFSEKLNIIFGTNGLGKTTLLNIIQYAIIGPYCGKQTYRNYKDQQRITRPIHDSLYFRNRMKEVNASAEVEVEFHLGDDKYIVNHSLYDMKLNFIVHNGVRMNGLDIHYDKYEKLYILQNDDKFDEYLVSKYHEELVKSSRFPDVDSYITMLTETMFFTEKREFIFWDESLSKLILSKYFMSPSQYFEYDEAQRLVVKYDSQVRLKTYKMSMVKDFLSDNQPTTDGITGYSIEDLRIVDDQIESYNKNITNLEKKINKLENTKIDNRIVIENVNRKLVDIEDQWYKRIFPDDYQKMFNKFVPSILAGTCPFCNSNHLRLDLDMSKCFYCSESIDIIDNVPLLDLELTRKNLEIEKNRLNSNYKIIINDISKHIKDKRNMQLNLSKLLDEQNIIKQSINYDSDDNYSKYQKLEFEKQELQLLLKNAKNEEQKLVKKIDEQMKTVFVEFSKIFKKYAYSFMGTDKKIRLELVGSEESQLFKFYLNETHRENSSDLSESQRIFIDMSFRLALLEFLHVNSYLISETPDSTLDFLFEENAVNTFSNYIESNNTLFLSANARNSKLITSLVEIYQDDCNIINLLEYSNLVGSVSEQVYSLDLFKFLRGK